eukprot:Nitzschia sp. Nitz4//scaffold66_size103028//7778//10630//NITZ4_004488-RA/size103028-snap-gene-0.133-mRNA-1//-1//CDS//3329556320//1590//frame0
MDTSSQSNNDSSPSRPKSLEAWQLSVKAVGGGFESNATESPERQFTVQVSPEDTLESLQDQIEASTGLKASQQRLIYRGRLITSSHDQDKLKDIVGLSNGHTIHLVKKRDVADGTSTGTAASPPPPGSTEATSAGTSEEESSANPLFGPTASSSGSGNWLAAFLGLSGSADEDSDRSSRPRRRAVRPLRPQPRRPPYRMTHEDWQLPDPGSLEPVRQGLMTLHTLLPHLSQPLSDVAAAASASAAAAPTTTPIQANRQWYRGQWIDCRDTVNQWLEATVVEIVHPHEILPTQQEATPRPRCRPPILAEDPAVTANDLEGRRRLLLEPTLDSFDEADLGGELAGYRPRSNNDGVQLLLIHYNGWPHRWDEWIRSDSERIRPFRTRTRHATSTTMALPTPRSVFHETPRTNIVQLYDEEEDADVQDRQSLLPELALAVQRVHEQLQRVVRRTNGEDADGTAPGYADSNTNTDNAPTTPAADSDLPWMWRPNVSATNESQQDQEPPELATNVDVAPDEDEDILDDLDVDLPELADETAANPVTTGTSTGTSTVSAQPRAPRYNRQEMHNLATLLDRLGRTLTDAAPHVASLAASMDDEAQPEASNTMTPSERLFSTLSRNPDEVLSETADATTVDPDHIDYVSGLVNTTRGEVRSGPRSRSSNDDVTNLLGAYLAAASLGGLGMSDGDDDGTGIGGLGQLLRGAGATGSGPGGIDIHIHAVVTSPGGSPGGVGLTALGSPSSGGGIFSSRSATRRSGATASILRNGRGASGSSNNNSASPVPSRSTTFDDDDIGLFSELYSETPASVDPNGSPRSEQPQMASSSLAEARERRREAQEAMVELFNPSNLSELSRSNNSSNNNTNTGVSSTRRRSRRASDSQQPRNFSPSETPRRRSTWGRLFGRGRSSRDATE